MRMHRTSLALAGSVLLATGAACLLPTAAQAGAAVTVPCSETALIAAVNAANTAGGGTITLTKGCTYTLTSAHGNDGVNGPDGLPIITTPIAFSGNANTITRSATAAAFRIVQVAASGGLALNAVTLSGGNATTAGHNHGGGVLNFGAVTLTGSAINSNTAGGLGGAIYSSGAAAAATFTSSTVRSNTANQAAGIASAGATLTMTSSVVTLNTAATQPGGIHSSGTSTMTTTSVTANTPTNCIGSPQPVTGCVG
ncbi:hypothetical protein [Streptomyces sp. RKAG293]|uniref:hypothetical protein n=1 Tax=Streptomyces sp. RKAG293 TaxID=2893403 RepID=UPI0020347363|nr:hypothetical protein [Streptomyces sp. RKAG293]MCM2417272.1 hypothetical protein [Streptomyces sp. RKAG293]